MKTYYFIISRTKDGLDWILSMTSDYKKHEEDLKILNSKNPRVKYTIGAIEVED